MQDDEHLTGGASSELAFHLSAIKVLYTASEGKNPAAEVYAAHYFSFDQVSSRPAALHACLAHLRHVCTGAHCCSFDKVKSHVTGVA